MNRTASSRCWNPRTKSSAYRTMYASPRTSRGRHSRANHSSSTLCRYTFASSGDIGAPCGVPRTTSASGSASMTPALSHFRHKAQHPLIPDAHLQKRHQPLPVDTVEEPSDVHLDDPVDLAPFHRVRQCVQRIMRRAPRPEPVREAVETRFVNRVQEIVHHRPLNDFVLQRDNTERPYSPVRLGNLHTPHGLRPVRSPLHAAVQVEQSLFQPSPYSLHATPSTPGAASRFAARYAPSQRLRRDVVQERVNFSPGFRSTNCRIRSAPGDTAPRLCVRTVPVRCGFLSAGALRSSGSAGARAPLFAAFLANTAPSDCCASYIIGYGCLPPRCGPGVRLAGTTRSPPRSRCWTCMRA